MFGKCQHPFPDFLLKSSSELEIEVYLSHMIKKILNFQTHRQHQKSGSQETFSLNTETRKISTVLLFNFVLKILANAVRPHPKKERTNYNIFVNTTVFFEKLGKYKIIRIEDLSEAASYRTTTEKLMSFLLPTNLLENTIHTTKPNKRC